MIKTKFGVTVLHKVDYPHSSVSKESDFKAGDPGSMLGWEDPLEEEMATRSSILVCKILWRVEPGGLHSMGSQRVRYNWLSTQ